MKTQSNNLSAIMVFLMVLLLPTTLLFNRAFAADAERTAVTTFFYDFNDGQIPDDIIIIDANEGDNNNGNPATGEVTWIIAPTSGIGGSPCLYNRTHPGPADDWIVTPLTSLTEDYVLSFFARCNASWPDSLMIWASTTGTEVEDFTILVAEGFRVAGTFTKYDFVITDHPELNHGDEVYIGIWNYTHGSRIWLDDLAYGEGDPGELIRAYTASEDGLYLLYNGPVLGASLDAGNFILKGTEDVVFANAEVSPDNNRLLHLSQASAPIIADFVADTIMNNVTGEFLRLYAGISPVKHANINNPDGSLPDDFPATFEVIVMAKNGTNRVWVADGGGPRDGINSYGSEFHDAVEVGDKVLVYGRVSPFQHQTEILGFYGKTISTGHDLFDPYVITGAEIHTGIPADTDPAEMYEGLLVHIMQAEVTEWASPYFLATDDGGNTHFRIGNGFNLFDGTFNENTLEIGTVYNVTGFVVNRDGPYRVVPRDMSDIVEHEETLFEVEFIINDLEGNLIDDAVVTLDGVQNAPGDYAFLAEAGSYDFSVTAPCFLFQEGEITVIMNMQHEVVLETLTGDSNGDGIVNVLDLIITANYFIGNNPDPFCFNNADVNNDGFVNVLDLIGIANIFSSSKISPHNNLRSSGVILYPNKNGIVMESDGTLAGIQFELTGKYMHNIRILKELNDHELLYNLVDDKIRVIIFSVDNTPIPPGKVPILAFNHEILDMRLDEIIAGNLNAQEVPVVVENSFDTKPVIQNERAAVTSFFYDFNDGQIPDDIIIIDANEGENNNGNHETGEVTWIIAENQGIGGTPCLYNRTHPGPADDWIVTPLISITEGYVLSFFARCNASFPDSLEIYASTTGTEVEDFTILIAEGFRVAGTFTKYDFNISAHPDLNPGDEVYLGIWNYTHGSRIYVDDLAYGEGEPGVMIRAYTSSEDGIDILFDGFVGGESLIAENYILQGTEDITFGSAVVNEDNDRLLHLGDASAPILPDLEVDSILNTETGEFVKFYAGLFPVAYANINNPDGSLPGDYAASFQVLVMAKNGTNRAWLADGAGPRHGINAYGSEFHDFVEVGDEVIVYGRVSPYLFQTEILAFYGKTISTGNPLYDPYVINGADINTDIPPDTDPAEMYEGLLVKVYFANVTAFDAPNFIATDDDDEHSFRIGDGFNLFDGTFDENLLQLGETYDITGFVVNRDGLYRIVPRNMEDINEVIINTAQEITTDDVKIYPNPVREVLNVDGDNIRSIRIYDPTALLVHDIQNPGASSQISMKGLKPGLYIVVVEFANGSSSSQTIIRL